MVSAVTRGATLARVTARTHFPLSDLSVEVLQAEGTVQLIWRADGWPGGSHVVLTNQFCDPLTAAQLRAVADHLDRIFEGAA